MTRLGQKINSRRRTSKSASILILYLFRFSNQKTKSVLNFDNNQFKTSPASSLKTPRHHCVQFFPSSHSTPSCVDFQPKHFLNRAAEAAELAEVGRGSQHNDEFDQWLFPFMATAVY